MNLIAVIRAICVSLVLAMPVVSMAAPPYVIFFPSVARTATENSQSVDFHQNIRGMLCYLNVSAASGTTPTLDVKFQTRNPLTGVWIDIPGGINFAQKTTTGDDTLLLYPALVETANREQSTVIVGETRAVATIGGTTPSFTFSLVCVAL